MGDSPLPAAHGAAAVMRSVVDERLAMGEPKSVVQRGAQRPAVVVGTAGSDGPASTGSLFSFQGPVDEHWIDQDAASLTRTPVRLKGRHTIGTESLGSAPAGGVLWQRAAWRQPDGLEAHDFGKCVEVVVVVEHGRDSVFGGGAEEVVDQRQALSAGGTMGQRPHRVLGGADDAGSQGRGSQGRELFGQLVELGATAGGAKDLQASRRGDAQSIGVHRLLPVLANLGTAGS